MKKLRLMKIPLAMAMLLPVTAAVADTSKQAPIELDSTVVTVKTPEYQQYEYGMDLDIAKVISIKYFPPKPKFCGVIPARMTYEDSKGDRHAIRYLYPETSGCSN
jgi:hypothetical protein